MSQIKIEVPNDDSDALHYFGEAMIKLSACIRGESPVDVRVEPITYKIDTSDEEAMERLKQATEDLMRAGPAMLRENSVDGSIELHGKRKEPDVDTTSQQVESLTARFATPEELEKIDETLRNAGVDENTPFESVLMAESPTTDSNGTPWDERIHSASKALNADLTWRLRRKPKDMTDDDWTMYVNDVKVEICESQRESEKDDIDPEHYAAETAEGVNDIPEPPVTPAGDDFHVDTGEVTEQEVAAIPVPPLPPVPVVEEKTPPVGYEHAHMSFPDVMKFLTERHGRITSAQVDDIIADMGLNSIMDLNTQPEHTGPFIARVKSLLGE